MHTVQVENDLLVVQLTGKLDQQSLLDAQKDLMLHPEYPFKNSLWIFDAEFECCFSNSGLSVLINRIKTCFPAGATKQKAALLATLGVHSMFTQWYCEEAEAAGLPFQFKAFHSRQEAEAWLRED